MQAPIGSQTHFSLFFMDKLGSTIKKGTCFIYRKKGTVARYIKNYLA